MNMQNLINKIEIEDKKRELKLNENIKFFYPEIWKQEQADRDITLCCKSLGKKEERSITSDSLFIQNFRPSPLSILKLNLRRLII